MLDKKFKSLAQLQDYYICLFKRKSEDAQHLSSSIDKLMDKNLFSEYEKHFKILSYNDKFDLKIAVAEKKLLKKQVKQQHKQNKKLRKQELSKQKKDFLSNYNANKPKRKICVFILKPFKKLLGLISNLFKKKSKQ